MKSLPKLVAEEAAEYSRRRFAEKNFDGKPWKPLSPHYHPTRGTLLVRSGALLNSVRVVSTSQEKVVIGAGNSKVKYAKVHNEGFSGSVVVKGCFSQYAIGLRLNEPCIIAGLGLEKYLSAAFVSFEFRARTD